MPYHYGEHRAKKASEANVRTLKKLDKSMLGVNQARGFAGFGYNEEKVAKHLKSAEQQIKKIRSMGSNPNNLVVGEYNKSRFDKNIEAHNVKLNKRNTAIVKGLKIVGEAAKTGLKFGGPIGVLMSLFDAKPAGLGSDKPGKKKFKVRKK